MKYSSPPALLQREVLRNLVGNEENLEKRLYHCTPLPSIAAIAIFKWCTNWRYGLCIRKCVWKSVFYLIKRKIISVLKVPTKSSSKAYSNLCILRNLHCLYSYLLQKAKDGVVLQVRNVQLQFRFLFSLVLHPVQNLSKVWKVTLSALTCTNSTNKVTFLVYSS